MFSQEFSQLTRWTFTGSGPNCDKDAATVDEPNMKPSEKQPEPLQEELWNSLSRAVLL